MHAREPEGESEPGGMSQHESIVVSLARGCQPCARGMLRM
jgi:hypothetical protein